MAGTYSAFRCPWCIVFKTSLHSAHIDGHESRSVTTRRAACSCGQLHLTIEGEPLRISMCSCLACQRRTGAVISNQARFRREQVTFAGKATTWSRTAESGHALDAGEQQYEKRHQHQGGENLKARHRPLSRPRQTGWPAPAIAEQKREAERDHCFHQIECTYSARSPSSPIAQDCATKANDSQMTSAEKIIAIAAERALIACLVRSLKFANSTSTRTCSPCRSA